MRWLALFFVDEKSTLLEEADLRCKTVEVDSK